MNKTFSDWGKWDLHVHTPCSIVQEYKSSEDVDVWDKFIDELEKLDIKTLGINDYWFINGYKKILEYKNKGRLKNIKLILPILEIRLKCLVGNSSTNKINYHIIFSNELTIDEIEEEFIKKIEIEGLENRSLTIKNLEAYGKKIQKNMPEDKNKNNNFVKEGFNSFAIEIDKIKKLLDKEIFKNKYLLAIGRSEWEDFRWDGSPDIKKSLINKANFIFVASPDEESFYRSKDKLTSQKVNDLLIHCSDAHAFPKSNNTTSKDLGHCFTWIKANCNFEGLKQVLFEPKFRLNISKERPTLPLYFIENIKINFRTNIKFGNNTFCFSNIEENIYFSPNLTCIIGGRGSGKSTLLNLIAYKLNIFDNNDFFDKLNIDNKELLNSISIKPDSLNNVEYLAQNTIENFAIDSKSFSEAIFKRLNKISKMELENIENNINNNLEIFDRYIKYLIERRNKHNILNKKKKELKNYSNIVKTLTDKEYLEKKNFLQKIQKEYSILENSMKKLFSFLEIIYEATTQEPYDILNSVIMTSTDDFEVPCLDIKDLFYQEPKNQFDELYNTFLLEVQKLYTETLNCDKYKQGIQRLKELNEESKKVRNDIYIFLRKKGIKEESIQDIQIANEKIEKLKLEISRIKNEISENKRTILKFNFSKVDNKIEKYKQLIEEQILKANNMLRDVANQNDDVKIIKINFEIEKNFFDDLFNELENVLNISDEIRSYRETFKNYIKEVSFDNILSINFQDFIEKIAKRHRNTQTYNKINEIFNNKTNYLIFKTLIQKYTRNITLNKNFKVYYDDRDIKDSSFGQKCTSVIVIMLLLGNNPIIIDEPEAHLDSSLIANYLVNLIKEIKQDRQIIFATHNANFVLNADAELIIKLENTDGTTKFNYFSIENIEYRKDLLKLEGGKEAFKMRESKYGI